MNADDHFDEFYRSEGIRFFEDLSHRGFMRHAYLHGWAAAKAELLAEAEVERLRGLLGKWEDRE